MSKANDDDPTIRANAEAADAPGASSDAVDTSGGAATGTAGEVRRSRRAAQTPVDAPASAAPRERVSLARARDREALRTYRALAEQSGTPDAVVREAMPTRRQLRLQQQAAQTGTEPADPASPAPAPVSGPPAPAAGAGSTSEPGGPTVKGNPSGSTAVKPAEVWDGVERRKEVNGVRPGGRRDRRRRLDTADPQTGASAEARAGALPAGDLSVEQALAAREAIIGQARNQVAMMEAANNDDPFAVDLELLAQQKALAERAAVLNSRAQKIQQLSEENQQRRPQVNDPTTAHNLSIVAPAEYVRVPGVNRPVLKAPTTSHIPVVTGAPAPQPGNADLPGGSPRSDRRSRVLARAESMASGQPADGGTPVHARAAHGLDPLDAMTAGLARVKRTKYTQYSILGLGVLALLTGIMMIVGSFGG